MIEELPTQLSSGFGYIIISLSVLTFSVWDWRRCMTKNTVHLDHFLLSYAELRLLRVISFYFHRSIGGFALEDQPRLAYLVSGQSKQINNWTPIVSCRIRQDPIQVFVSLRLPLAVSQARDWCPGRIRAHFKAFFDKLPSEKLLVAVWITLPVHKANIILAIWQQNIMT